MLLQLTKNYAVARERRGIFCCDANLFTNYNGLENFSHVFLSYLFVAVYFCCNLNNNERKKEAKKKNVLVRGR